MTTPGSGGLLWPPQVKGDAGNRTAIEDELVQFASIWLRQRGARLAQAMLSPDEAYLGQPLERNGFAHVTTLCYLRRDLSAPLPAEVDTLTYQPYPADPHLFGQTLLDTYEGTEDCPELTGARNIDEIIEGHRAQGVHDPQQWWLACFHNQPVGVLLLTRMLEWASYDVSYVGVVSSARRRGFGRQLMLKAMAEARRNQTGQLTLSVDHRNGPAWRLYRSLGCEQFDQREVYLAVWKRSGSTP
jgi:ribosomal protein S18 acetylase RimI-like enzyme